MDVIKLSRYVIAYSEQIGKPVNNMRLQALLYYLQHLFFNDVKYSKDGIFYVPDAYYEYCYEIHYLRAIVSADEEIPIEVKEVVDRYSNTPTWKIIERIVDEHIVNS